MSPHDRGFNFRVVRCWMLSLAAALGVCRGVHADESKAPTPAVLLKGMVIGADGQPVGGALIAFMGPWRQSRPPVAIETETDATGRFELTPPAADGLPGAYLGTVWAYARGSGIARQELKVAAESELQLQVPPGGETRIKVVDPGGAPAVGVQVMHAGLRIALTRNGETVYGAASLPEPIAVATAVATDSAGMAILTAMTPDEVSGVRCVTQAWGEQGARRPHESPDEPVIRLRRVGRVRGRVICDDPRAVRRIKVRLTTTAGNAEDYATSVSGEAIVVTDDAGRFEATLAAGRLRASASPPSDLPYLPASTEDENLVAGSEAEVSIELNRAVTIRGVVREKGGALLTSNPRLLRNLAINRRESAFVEMHLNRDGRFEFLHPLGRSIQMFASQDEDRHSWVVFEISPDYAGELLDIPPLELLQAKGRIVDETGRPVPGARVEQAWRQYEYEGQRAERKLRYGSEPQLLSVDADGRFEVQVVANNAYRLLVAAEGMESTLTDWVDFSQPEVNAFPDIVLRRSRTLSGRVVDRQGRPLAGVTVFQAANRVKRTEAVSDRHGGYKLDGLNADSGFVFARGEGYRFHGQIVDGDATRLDIVMTGTHEAPEPQLQPLSQAVKREEELALCRRLVQPRLAKVLASDDDAAKRRALETWALVDPQDCLRRFEDTKFADREEADAVCVAIARSLVAEQPDQAIAVLESVENRWHRAFGAIELTRAAPADAREVKLKILSAGLPSTESNEEPPMRIISLALMARKLTGLGEHPRAEKIARELASQVIEIAYDPEDCCGASMHVAVAMALAPYDLQAALKLTPKQFGCAGAEDEDARSEAEAELRRFQLLSIARAIAETDPAESERVIGLLEGADERAGAIVSLCPKLAVADLPRARRLAATIEDPCLRAGAESELAKALAVSNPSAAADCLSEAFRLLAQAANAPESASLDDAELAARLLPVAERVAPERLGEFFWQTLALTHSEQQLSLDSAYDVQTASAVAAFAARYDRRAARLLLGEPDTVLARLAGAAGHGRSRGYAAFFAAMTSIDVEEAIALIDRLSDEAAEATDGKSPREAAQLAIVQLLASEGLSRQQTLDKLVGIPDYSEDDF